MLRSRLIPFLLLKNSELVKTTNFKDPKYVGDPLNAVKIFNEKSADELSIIDIDASAQNRSPNYDLIKKIAAQCQMPLCYGGGIKNVEQVKKLVSLGVEKIAISSEAIKNPQFLNNASEEVGSQSIVMVLDVKKNNNEYDIFINNGKINTNISLNEFLKKVEKIKFGELIINSIDKDGCLNGYDINLLSLVNENINMPITILGGGSSFNEFSLINKNFGPLGIGVGSLFVFKGKFRAVLINYPTKEEKLKIFFNSKYY